MISLLPSHRKTQRSSIDDQRLAEDRGTPSDVLTDRAEHGDDIVRALVAANPNTPADALTLLARSKRPNIRYLAASHPNTPAQALAELTRDRAVNVALQALSNPNVPIGVLREHAVSANDTIRATVAHLSRTPGDVHARLARDPVVRVRMEAVDRAGIPTDLLDELSRDEDGFVRARAARKLTDAARLDELSSDWDWVVRAAVAENDWTPLDTLQRLCTHPNDVVRNAAHAARLARVILPLDDDARPIAEELLESWAGTLPELITAAQQIVRQAAPAA